MSNAFGTQDGGLTLGKPVTAWLAAAGTERTGRLNRISLALGLCGCALLAACGGKVHKHAEIAAPATVPAPAQPAPAPPPPLSMKKAGMDWHLVATDRDRERLRTWRDAWTNALARVRAADLAAQGALFDPDHALDGTPPPPGRYRCRVFKLGANGAGMREFTAYPPYECRIADEGEAASLYKIGGSQRPVGLLFSDGQSRQIFLGTMMFGDETKPMDYGRDDGRDMAGYVERVGEKRWRLVLPWPKFESILDVVELVPSDAPIKP